jgi:hypothetical protein
MAAVVAGIGGGLVISDILSPHAPRTELSKLELRMSERPIPATNASSEPAAPATSPAPAAAPVTQAAAPVAAAAPPVTQAAAPAAPAAPPLTQAATEPVKPPEAAFAKASDADVRGRADIRARDVDLKSRDADIRRDARRAAEEKRRAERRQQWAERRQQWTERRRHLQRQDPDLRDVEAKVREDTEPRQVFAAEPVKLDRIRLFDAE